MCPFDHKLESAIPTHLRVERTRRSLCPHGFEPPYPTFVGRFGAHVDRFAIMYLGVQFERGATTAAETARDQILGLLRLPDGPRYFDRASFTDEAGCDNFLFAAYWDDAAAFDRWAYEGNAADWWAQRGRGEDVGYYRECFLPPAPAMETHFSTHRPEGVAVLSDGMSGEIQEHAYWGGARDRIPLSQIDALEPGPGDSSASIATPDRQGDRIRLRAHDNLCLIRSGQDWSDTDTEEKALYEKDILPHLERGMTFLRDHGAEVGCIENRFVQCIDSAGASIGKSYGMSIWRSLGDLERWAASHPTNLAIFDAGGAYMEKLGANAGLRTYHEICVLPSQGQDFEYVGCHPRTGMLRASRERMATA